jgi:hypothetical protein
MDSIVPQVMPSAAVMPVHFLHEEVYAMNDTANCSFGN